MPPPDLTISQFKRVLKAAFHTDLTEFPAKVKHSSIALNRLSETCEVLKLVEEWVAEDA